MDTRPATAASILDAAQAITQSVGYNGLSFRDVAAAVGIRSASVHYHFPSKAVLAAAVARRYTDRVAELFESFDAATPAPAAAWTAYIAVFRTALEKDGRMCLCGMLAAEADALSEEVKTEVRRFVAANVRWLAGTLRRTAKPPPESAVEAQAMMIFAALEGAVLVTRGTGRLSDFDAMTAALGRSGLLPS